MIFPERKGWALYRRVSELLLCPKDGWRRIKWNLYGKMHPPGKRTSSWVEWLSILSEGKWAVDESQIGMMQNKVKLVCQCATPWKADIFLRGRVELFTGGWVSWCWVTKKNESENEKNDYKTDEENRKGKYKYLVWWNLSLIIING